MTQRRGHCFLIQGAPRSQLASALLEYRRFAAEHPDDPLTETLLDVSRKMRLGLKEKRGIMRATGEPGKVNAPRLTVWVRPGYWHKYQCQREAKDEVAGTPLCSQHAKIAREKGLTSVL